MVMINLVFMRGSEVRKVNISGRLVVLLISLTGYEPIEINLDNIKMSQIKAKMKKAQYEEFAGLLRQLKKLKTESDIYLDIKRDFQKTGWRLVKRDGPD
jgi:hypothetical protein